MPWKGVKVRIKELGETTDCSQEVLVGSFVPLFLLCSEAVSHWLVGLGHEEANCGNLEGSESSARLPMSDVRLWETWVLPTLVGKAR